MVKVECCSRLTLEFPVQTQLRCFPYHRIMCWGHNSEIFKFRTFIAPACRADGADDATDDDDEAEEEAEEDEDE